MKCCGGKTQKVMPRTPTYMKELKHFMVAVAPAVAEDMQTYAACIGGAPLKTEYLAAVERAGLQQIRVVAETPFEFTVLPQWSLLFS